MSSDCITFSFCLRHGLLNAIYYFLIILKFTTTNNFFFKLVRLTSVKFNFIQILTLNNQFMQFGQ